MTARDELAAWCLDKLHALAEQDRMAWYPVIGWVEANGDAYGLAVERFGPDFSQKQQQLLGKALFRLALDGHIEGANCRRKKDGRGLVLPPLNSLFAGMFVSTSSGGINPWNSEYIVRAAQTE